MPQDRLLTPREVSEILSIPESTLANWRYERRGPRYIKLGRAVRYAREDLDRWIAAGTVAPRRA